MTKVAVDGMDGSGSRREQPVRYHVIFSTLTQKLNIGELVRPRDIRGGQGARSISRVLQR